jgi:hypothetical protein
MLGERPTSLCPRIVRRNDVYQSVVKRGREENVNDESLLGKGNRCTGEASGAMARSKERV